MSAAMAQQPTMTIAVQRRIERRWRFQDGAGWGVDVVGITAQDSTAELHAGVAGAREANRRPS